MNNSQSGRIVGSDGYTVLDLVVIGGSLGGIVARRAILSELPADFPAAVAVVLHRNGVEPGRLEWILGLDTQLRVRPAVHGGRFAAGVVDVAPGGSHLLIGDNGAFELSDGPKVRSSRPSVDCLFESASHLGGRIAAVVLTGLGRDGADGVCAVNLAGGRVIAQDEATSREFGMPGSAAATGKVDQVLPLGEIAAALIEWAGR